MDSRRLSCSFMARAASSMSLKVFGCLAAVWEITVPVFASTFSSPLQQGQVISKFAGRLGIARRNHTAKLGCGRCRRLCGALRKSDLAARKSPLLAKDARNGAPGLVLNARARLERSLAGFDLLI